MNKNEDSRSIQKSWMQRGSEALLGCGGSLPRAARGRTASPADRPAGAASRSGAAHRAARAPPLLRASSAHLGEL